MDRIGSHDLGGRVEGQARHVKTHEGSGDLAVSPGSRGATVGKIDPEPEVRRKTEELQSAEKRSRFTNNGDGQPLDRVGVASHGEQFPFIQDRSVLANPSGDDLSSDQSAFLHIEFGSEERLDLSAIEGPPQFDFVEGPSSIDGAHVGSEHFDAIPAEFFGSLQSLVGESEDGDRRRIVPRTNRNTHARADTKEASADFDRFDDRTGQSLGNRRSMGRGVICDGDGELVSADTCRISIGPDSSCDTSTDDTQQFVSRSMTEGVVDGLEAIEVEIENGGSSTIDCETRIESFEESGAIEKSGHLVVTNGVDE